MGSWLRNVYDPKVTLALPTRQEDCYRTENDFSTQYFQISETALLFGRITGICGMMTGEIPKCTEKNLSQCHGVHFAWTDLGTKSELRGDRMATKRPSHGTAQED
jgi:hypothetical protein